MNKTEFAGFFADLRDRKVVRSGDSGGVTTVKLTNKPFRPETHKQIPYIKTKHTSVGSKQSKSTKPKTKRKVSSTKQNSGKKKRRIENKLFKAKL